MTEPRLSDTFQSLKDTFYGVVSRREGVDTISGCQRGRKSTMFRSAALESITVSTTSTQLLHNFSLCYKRVAATKAGCGDGLVVPVRPSFPTRDVMTRYRILEVRSRKSKIAELGALNRGVSEQYELLTEAIRAN